MRNSVCPLEPFPTTCVTCSQPAQRTTIPTGREKSRVAWGLGIRWGGERFTEEDVAYELQKQKVVVDTGRGRGRGRALPPRQMGAKYLQQSMHEPGESNSHRLLIS